MLSIHPKHKRPVGERLALLARGHIYGEDILCDAPRLLDVILAEEEAILRFNHADGLHRKTTSALIPALKVNDQPCAGRIEGDSLIIPLPQADQWRIAYADTDYYQVDLYNAANIPAVAFSVTVKR